MPVDVLTDIVIERPRDEVAAYAGDPGTERGRAWLAEARAGSEGRYSAAWALAVGTMYERLGRSDPDA